MVLEEATEYEAQKRQAAQEKQKRNEDRSWENRVDPLVIKHGKGKSTCYP